MSVILGIYVFLLAVLLVLDVAVVALFVYVTARAREVRPDILGAPTQAAAETGAQRRTEAVRKAWDEIEQGAARGAEGKRLAVINADRLVDQLLKDAGYEGEGALERMKQLPAARIASLNDLFAAHRFRNRVVHEVGFAPDDRALDTALAQFKAFLTEVGYL